MEKYGFSHTGAIGDIIYSFWFCREVLEKCVGGERASFRIAYGKPIGRGITAYGGLLIS